MTMKTSFLDSNFCTPVLKYAPRPLQISFIRIMEAETFSDHCRQHIGNVESRRITIAY